MATGRTGMWTGEPFESVQEQTERELELELIVAALADDGRFETGHITP